MVYNVVKNAIDIIPTSFFLKGHYTTCVGLSRIYSTIEVFELFFPPSMFDLITLSQQVTTYIFYILSKLSIV